jgi:DNA-binding PadR family transcriptional regulator
LASACKRNSRDMDQMSPGTLYPLLNGLEKTGYLRSWEERDGKSHRRVFRATPKGQQALRAAKKKIKDCSLRFQASLSLRRSRGDPEGTAALHAGEGEQLGHSGRRCMRGAAVRTPNLRADLGRQEEADSGAFNDVGRPRFRVGRTRIEVRDRLLKPGHDLRCGWDALLREIPVDVVSHPDVDSSVPQPADPDVDFAIVRSAGVP